HRRGAVVDAGAVPGSYRAPFAERRPQPRERLGRRVGPGMLVARNDDSLPFRPGHRDRHDLLVEPTGLDRGDRVAMAREPERVLPLARDVPLLRDVLARLAH